MSHNQQQNHKSLEWPIYPIDPNSNNNIVIELNKDE